MTKALNRTFLMGLVLALGCGDDATTTDAGPPGMIDSGPGGVDAGPPGGDAGPGTDSGPPGMGMCTNAPDMMAVTRENYGPMMMDSYGDIVTDCATMCFIGGMMTEPGFSTCTRMCVDEDTMMSATNGCRDCYVARAVCAASNCAVPCLMTPEMCTACQCENDCVSAFNTCSGLPDDSCEGM